MTAEAVKMLMLKHSGRCPVNGPELEQWALTREAELESKKASDAADHEKFVREFVSPNADTVADAEILRICREHFNAAPPDHSFHEEFPRWAGWKLAMRAEIQTGFKTCREALHYAQSSIPFDHRQVLVDPPVEIGQYARRTRNRSRRHW